MRTRLLAMMVGVGMLGVVTPVFSHHSFSAEYDAQARVTLRGTVVKMEWINPHSWIHLDVKRPDGQVERWRIETGPPSGLVRRGFTKASVPPGVEIVVAGYRAKDGSLHAAGQTLTLPDGRALFAGSPGSGTPGEQAPK